jgi:quercetin 2,3-dioxygenase
MDLTLRRAEDRGHADFGWLDSRHTFSFGEYFDRRHMGFGPLRVINDDRVVGGAGFPTHPHRDMEIISYVLKGALKHRDTLGTTSVIRPGEVQRMTAGAGIRHSEYNVSDREPVRFLQIWIIPDRQGLKPGYEQKSFSEAEKRDRLRLVASGDGRDGAVTIHRDVDLYATLFSTGKAVTHEIGEGRGGWVQVARGALRLNGQAVKAGDGVSILGPEILTLAATEDSEALLFDMAMTD